MQSYQQKEKQCSHSTIIKTQNRQNCFQCGIYLPSDQTIIAYREKSMSYECLIDLERNYTSMFKYNFQKLLQNLSEHYKKQREELINYINELGNRLQFTQHTINLGILFMDIVNMKETIPPQQLNLYAITSIFLASKAIELDIKIPFISKLRKYTSLHYRPEEIKKAEIHVIKLLDWQLQLCTFSQILDFYFTQGILFSNDEIEKDANLEKQFSQMNLDENKGKAKEEEMKEILQKISKDSLKLNSLINKDLSFFAYDRKALALACIIYLRKKHNIVNWNKELEIISGGLQEEQIKDILQILEKKFEFAFNQQPILTSNPHKINYQIPGQNEQPFQQCLVKQIEPIKQIELISQRGPPPAFLQPRKENISQREIATTRICNEQQQYHGNFMRQQQQQFQKKVTQEFPNQNNEMNQQNRKLYRLNTAYPVFETKINQFNQFN